MNLKYVFIEKKNRHLELIKNNPLIEHMKIKNDRNKVLQPFSFVIVQLKTEEKKNLEYQARIPASMTISYLT